MMNCKKIFCVLLCLCFLFGLVGCQASEKEKLQKVSVCEVTHSIFYAPQYIAEHLGFFEEEGLSVSFTNGQGADAVMSAVLSGHADIGFAGPEASVYVYQEGKADYTQVFAQMTRCDGSFLMARDFEEPFSWKNLKGKTLLPGRVGGVPYMTLEYVLRQNGIDPEKDVVMDSSVQFSSMTAAFLSGVGDYVTVFEPTASQIEENGQGFIVASVGKESGSIPYTAYFAKKSYLEKNEDIILRFTRAIYRGLQWAQEHSSEEIAKAVQPAFPDTELSLLTKSVENYRQISAWKTTPVMEQEDFEKLEEIMLRAGELSEAVPFNDVINNRFAEQVAEK